MILSLLARLAPVLALAASASPASKLGARPVVSALAACLLMLSATPSHAVATWNGDPYAELQAAGSEVKAPQEPSAKPVSTEVSCYQYSETDSVVDGAFDVDLTQYLIYKHCDIDMAAPWWISSSRSEKDKEIANCRRRVRETLVDDPSQLAAFATVVGKPSDKIVDGAMEALFAHQVKRIPIEYDSHSLMGGKERVYVEMSNVFRHFRLKEVTPKNEPFVRFMHTLIIGGKRYYEDRIQHRPAILERRAGDYRAINPDIRQLRFNHYTLSEHPGAYIPFFSDLRLPWVDLVVDTGASPPVIVVNQYEEDFHGRGAWMKQTRSPLGTDNVMEFDRSYLDGRVTVRAKYYYGCR